MEKFKLFVYQDGIDEGKNTKYYLSEGTCRHMDAQPGLSFIGIYDKLDVATVDRVISLANHFTGPKKDFLNEIKKITGL